MKGSSEFPGPTGIALRLTALFTVALLPSVVWASPGLQKPAVCAANIPAGPIRQLRMYELFDETKAAFHERFRDHAVRIMKRHGFKIISIWETSHEGRPTFVYMLDWPDQQTMESRWASFMADQEWSDIKRQTGIKHGRFVNKVESLILNPVEYTPDAKDSLIGCSITHSN